MTSRARERFMGLVDTAGLAAWAWLLLWMYAAGRLGVLIHPSFHALVLGAGVALIPVALAVLAGAMGDGHAAACDCGHDHGPGRAALAARLGMRAVLVAPLLLAFQTPMKGLSAEAIQRRGIREVVIGSAGVEPRASAPTPAAAAPPTGTEPSAPGEEYAEISVRELMSRASGPDGEAAIENLRVSMLGQVLKSDDCGPNEFKLYRILITCCLADAEVVGIRVVTSKPFTREMAGQDADRGEADALVRESRMTGDSMGRRVAELLTDLGGWVRVYGRLGVIVDRDGYKALQLTAAKVERADPPVQKYLFQDTAALGY